MKFNGTYSFLPYATHKMNLWTKTNSRNDANFVVARGIGGFHKDYLLYHQRRHSWYHGNPVDAVANFLTYYITVIKPKLDRQWINSCDSVTSLRYRSLDLGFVPLPPMYVPEWPLSRQWWGRCLCCPGMSRVDLSCKTVRQQGHLTCLGQLWQPGQALIDYG